MHKCSATNTVFRMRAMRYVKIATSLAKRTLGDNLVSIILFGSLARCEATKISDVDLLIVVRRFDHNTKKLEKILRLLSIKLGLTFIPQGFFGRLFYALSNATGMFRPAFIAERESIRNWEFEEVFNTSKFMSRVLAPKESVKSTIMSSYHVLYGEDPFAPLTLREPSYIEVIKSLLMNMLLATCSFVLIPFHRETYRFIYEAIKWSLFNYSYIAGIAPMISDLTIRFRNPIKFGIKYFVDTRNNGRLNPALLAYAIPTILKIHMASLRKLKKLRLRRSTKSS